MNKENFTNKIDLTNDDPMEDLIQKLKNIEIQKKQKGMKMMPNEDYTTTKPKTKITTKKKIDEPTITVEQPNKHLGNLVDTIFTSLNNELVEDNEIFQNDKETVIRKTSKGKEIILKTKLFPYQKQGLQFMKSNESESKDVRGGLLCDEMVINISSFIQN